MQKSFDKLNHLRKLNLILLAVAILLTTACRDNDGNANDEQQRERQEDLGRALETETPGKAQQSALKRDTVTIELKALGNTMKDMRFDKEEIKVPANSVVKIVLVNEGESSAMQHNFVLCYQGTMEVTAKAALKAGPDKEYVPDVRTVLAATPMAQPQQTVEAVFAAPEAGTYEFICSYPGHWQRTNGKFIVEGESS